MNIEPNFSAVPQCHSEWNSKNHCCEFWNSKSSESTGQI